MRKQTKNAHKKTNICTLPANNNKIALHAKFKHFLIYTFFTNSKIPFLNHICIFLPIKIKLQFTGQIIVNNLSGHIGTLKISQNQTVVPLICPLK